MTDKIHGAAYPGIWVERQVVFINVTFAAPVNAVAQDSGFGVVESCVVQALKDVAQRGTILGVSPMTPATAGSGVSFQVMLGYASGLFAPTTSGVISAAVPVVGKAVNKTVPTAPVPAADLVTTYDLSFAYWDGSLPAATGANGALAIGPGATSGATPTNSPTGTPGWYPVG